MSRHAYRIATLLFVVLVLSKFTAQSGFTELIRFGEAWQDRRYDSLRKLPIATVQNSYGYDGQFYAQIALDPLLRGKTELQQAVDIPAYRARRILVPVIAAIFGLGQPWWTLQAYALVNVACWFALAWLLYRETNRAGWTGFARWFACLFSLGVLDSVRQSLVDLPALLFLTLAIGAHHRARLNRSALWLGLSNLAKEASLLGTFALSFSKEQLPLKRLLPRLAVAILPLALWALYVQYRLPSPRTSDGLGNLTWPILGLTSHLVACMKELGSGNLDGRYSMGLIAALGLLLQAGSLWRTPATQTAWWRVGAAYAVLLLFLSSWVWSGYWAACRAVLPMTIAFNLLLPCNRYFWPLWIAGNLSLLHGVWRFL